MKTIRIQPERQFYVFPVILQEPESEGRQFVINRDRTPKQNWEAALMGMTQKDLLAPIRQPLGWSLHKTARLWSHYGMRPPTAYSRRAPVVETLWERIRLENHPKDSWFF